MGVKPNLAIDFAGLKLARPLVAASGTFGYGEDFVRIEQFANEDLGAAVLKSASLEPRTGNPTPRIVETPQGILNAIGLENPGVDAIIRDYLPRLSGYDCLFIANAVGSSADDFAKVAEKFDAAPNVSALEVNISCPNVARGTSFSTDPALAAEVIGAVKNATELPVIAKLSPESPSITDSGQACVEAGADALSLVNTFKGLAIDVRTRKPMLGYNTGGLSGPAIRPLALRLVSEVYRAVAQPAGVPILGYGGVMTAQDALEFLIAGATAVGIGTALFVDPLAPQAIAAGIAQYMQENKLDDLSTLVGTLQIQERE